MVKEKNKNIFDEYKYALMVGFGSFLLLIILVFAIGRPLWSELGKSSDLLKEKRAVLVKLEDKLANLKSLKSKEAELKEKNDKVLSALPTDKDVSRLFVQFENIAATNGLIISDVSESSSVATAQDTTTSNTEPGTVRAVTYSVRGTTTDYGSLKNALSNLEKALRILSVSKIDVSGNGANLSVSLTVSTYLRSE